MRTATPSAIPPNYSFTASANIAPSWHVGPRGYSAAGIILHPLQMFGGTPQYAGGPQAVGGKGPLASSPVAAMLGFAPHAFTINGRAPG